MTYDQIQVFILIAQKGSFKAASEILHRTQPSLSAAIKKLEGELGFELFDRSHYRPQLTLKGRALLEQATRALESFDNLNSFAQSLKIGHEAEIHLCMDAVAPLQTIGPFFKTFFQAHQQTKLNLKVDILEGSLNRLLNKEVDLAIAPMIKEDSSFTFKPLGSVMMIPVISPLLHQQPTFEQLMEIPQIVVRSQGEDKTQSYGVEQGIKWYLTDHYLKAHLIQNSLGWGRLPHHVVEDHLASGRLISLEKTTKLRALRFEFAIAKRRQDSLGPITQSLWDEFPLF
jgi:DNA-binding transcriptional LysR family regulator